MAIKQLLSDHNRDIQELAQWEQRRENIRAHLFETIGIPPVTRNTQSIQIINEKSWANMFEARFPILLVKGKELQHTYYAQKIS